MGTAAHSRAPWRFLEEGDTESEWNVGRPLTVCGGNNDDLAKIYSLEDATVEITRDEAIANARLIAAAPDLLASLQEISEGCVNYRPGHVNAQRNRTKAEIEEIARAAIAKATGAA